jgi:hypothetical protein
MGVRLAVRDTTLIQFNPAGASHNGSAMIRKLREFDDVELTGPDALGVYTMTFRASTPSLDSVRSELARNGVEWFETRDRRFSDDELRSFPLLRLGVDAAPRGGAGGGSAGGFDTSAACATCGTGAVQSEPLVLKRADLPRKADIFETLAGDIVVSNRLRREFTDAGITGAELREVVVGREAAGWFQLIPTRELPPMHRSTRGLKQERPCPQCDRDGYFMTASEPLEIRYDRSLDVDSLPDFTSTWERFGNSRLDERGRVVHVARPLVIIGQPVLDVLRRSDVANATFDQVVVVDDADDSHAERGSSTSRR